MLRSLKHFIWVLPLIILLINSCTFDNNSSQPSESVSDVTIPRNPAPADGAADVINRPTLQWTSDNTVSYDIIIDTNNPPSPVSANSKVVLRQAGNTFTLQNPLSFSTNYYWRVYAYASDGSMKEGPVWRFSTLAGSLPIGSGYAMYFNQSNTASPNVVNVIFQVVDMNKRGVTNLQSTDFNIAEDGVPITSESLVNFSRYPELPLKIYTCLMLDNSSSLSQSDLEQIKSAAKSYVANNITLGGKQVIKVYQFSETIDSLYTGFSDDPVMINSKIDMITLGKSSTNLYGAVVLGETQLKDQASIDGVTKGVMILFTDGTDTQGSTSLTDALTSINSKSVFTIGLGNEIDPDVLRSFGTSGYFNISSADQLQPKLAQIQSILSDNVNSYYKMVYNSPKRGNFDHLLTITIKNNLYNGNDSYLQVNYNSIGF